MFLWLLEQASAIKIKQYTEENVKNLTNKAASELLRFKEAVLWRKMEELPYRRAVEMWYVSLEKMLT